MKKNLMKTFYKEIGGIRILMPSFFLALLIVFNSYAQEVPSASIETYPGSIRWPQNPVELEIFLDGLFPALLEPYGIGLPYARNRMVLEPTWLSLLKVQ